MIMDKPKKNDKNIFKKTVFLHKIVSITQKPYHYFADLPIRIKLPLCFLLVIIIFCVFVGYSLYMIEEFQKKNKMIRESDLLVQNLYRFTHGVRDKYFISDNVKQNFLETDIKSFEQKKEQNLVLLDGLRPYFNTEQKQNFFNELERLNLHIDDVFYDELIPMIKDPQKHILLNIPMSELKNSMNQIDNLLNTIIRMVVSDNENLILTIQPEMNQMKVKIYYTIGFVVIASLTFSVFFSLRYAKRLGELVEKSKFIGQGDLRLNFNVDPSKDDLGQLCSSFIGMVQNLRDVIIQVKIAFTNIEKLSQEIKIKTKSSEENAEQVIGRTLALENGAATQMEVVAITKEWSEKINLLLQETISQLLENHNQASQVNKISEDGNERILTVMKWIENLHRFFNNTITRIKDLTELIKETKIIGTTVTEIARQTNLLALNAAIESARNTGNSAGFKVVAKEIKSLADQANSSTMEINDLLQDINKQLEKLHQETEIYFQDAGVGMEQISDTGELFTKINALITKMVKYIKKTLAQGEEVNNLNQNMNIKISELHQISKNFNLSLHTTVDLVQKQKNQFDEIFDLIPELNLRLNDLAKSVDKFIIK